MKFVAEKTVMDKIAELIKEVKEIINSKQNKEKEKNWNKITNLKQVDKIPVQYFINEAITPFSKLIWEEIFKINLNDVIAGDVRKSIEFQLKQKIFKSKVINDDIPVNSYIKVDLGISRLKKSFLGSNILTLKSSGAWVEESWLKNEEDIEKLKIEHYFSMPEFDKKYINTFKEVLNGELPVIGGLASEGNGSLELAKSVRSTENLLIDMLENPLFLTKLLRKVTDLRNEYNMKRAQILDINIGEGYISEDTVNCQLFSPKMYNELIFPFEKEIAEKHSAIHYHSCGNSEPIIEQILKLPNLKEVFLTMPWNRVEAISSVVKNKVLYTIALSPQFIEKASYSEVKEFVESVKTIRNGSPTTFMIASLHKNNYIKAQEILRLLQKYAHWN